MQISMTPEQHQVIHAIRNCRTATLGGHVEQCDRCERLHIAYNSCRNRHCPKCQSFRTLRWLEARHKELLPVPYFHVVFTLPHELNTLILYNKKLLYDLLFQSAWETIKQLGADPKRLGGLMGLLAILHTWGQNLSTHNHLHCIVPGGALVDGQRWRSSKKGYLFPVKVLSKLFRGIYVSKLSALVKKGQLKRPDTQSMDNLLDSLMKKDWVVYAKKPFAGPEKLLNYLGKYTHKIALSNYRIIACDRKTVTFTWRDYSDGNKIKRMTLQADEFIRRFLQHVVPKKFMRLRYYGFLASACKAKNIAAIKKHFPAIRVSEVRYEQDTRTLMLQLTGIDISICPTCKKGILRRVKDLPNKFSNVLFDTS